MSQDAYIARQPIFDTKQHVFGYELLFRSGNENSYGAVDGDKATSSVISDSFLLFGVDTLTQGKRAFINFTQNLLLDETATILPRDVLVVEILETVVPDGDVLHACQQLKEMGYVLALDDFVFEERFRPLMRLADIIKVDFMATDPEQRKAIIEQSTTDVKFLAEKVETHEEFEEAKALGYEYFQGYFFSKPVIISTKDMPPQKVTYLNILHEINRADVDFDSVETIIKRDVALSYKLLRFINSAFFGFSREIHSIKQATVLLGINELRRWVSLIILKGMGEDKPEELFVVSIVRARLCEMIGKGIDLNEQSSDLFLLGLFSMIDTFMSRPMEEVLEKLPLADETKQALLGSSGIFTEIYELVRAYERVDWDAVSRISQSIGLDQFVLADYYVESIEWAKNLLG